MKHETKVKKNVIFIGTIIVVIGYLGIQVSNVYFGMHEEWREQFKCIF